MPQGQRQTTEALLEMAIDSPRVAVWHRIGDDTDSVTQAFLHMLEVGDKRRPYWRAIVSLDRLLPLSASDAFLPYLGTTIARHIGRERMPAAFRDDECAATYAWARRQPTENRAILLDLVDEIQAFDHQPEDFWRSQLTCDSLLVAWAELCPSSDRASLLLPPRWNCYNLCGQIDIPSPWLLVAEYFKNVDDPARHFVDLLEASDTWLSDPRLTQSHSRSIYERYLMYGIFKVLMPLAVHPKPLEKASLAMGWEWLMDQFRAAGHEEAVRLLCGLAGPSYVPILWSQYLAASWPSDRWHALTNRAEDFVKESGADVFERLVEIIPAGEFDVWRDLLQRFDMNIAVIIAFCRWLRPSHAEELLEVVSELRGKETDATVCTYQAFLHAADWQLPIPPKTGHPRVPMWQAVLHNRWLYAPTALKPPRLALSCQTIEGDFRLRDPFDIRGY